MIFTMSSSIFSRLFGKSDKSKAENAGHTVDISRVIPDFEGRDRPREAQREAQEAPATLEAVSKLSSKPSGTALHPEDKAEAAVEALKEKHDAWAQNDLTKLTEAWTEARQHTDMSDHLSEVSRVAHNLKGMATTYGHPSVSRLATSLDQLLKSKNAGTQHALINLHIEACRAAYIEGSQTEHSDQIAQSVCVALEAQVKRALEA